MAIAGISAAALVLTACGGGSTTPAASDTAGAGSTTTSGGSATTSGSSTDGGTVGATSTWCEDVKSKYGDLTGKKVSVYTTIVAPEDQPYIDAYKLFTECTGAEVSYEGSKEFEAQIVVRVQSGNPPDIGIFPQPGLISQLVNDTGKVIPLDPDVETFARKYFPEDWMNYGVINDIPFGIPNNADFKSLVWYNTKLYKDNGYSIPTTWEELTALQDKVAATTPPWCIGIKSGEATGWQITDWLEEYVLRDWGPDVYDQWVKHEIPFNDPKIASSLAEVGKVLKDPKYVNAGFGGVDTIASTEFNDPSAKIQDGQCTLSRQAANFDANFKNVKLGPDGDVNAFYFPPKTTDFGNTVLGGGTFYAQFANAASGRPEVDAMMYFLASPEFANARAKAGSWISANRGLQASNVPSPIQQTALETLQKPDTTFRFDASDLMPAPVGSDAEWKQFTAWVTGQDDQTTLNNIEAAWPAS
ncbi:carbohydrate ABC transporter substrate-binding protein [Nakamurella flava]|uniref:Carbohydrate ABC transporter substrate-binding protein n=1 Tax=Nakamurella flava TaxID=2576308 RepID=A0A4V6CRK1_9ACTN|nr:ABC transporter substrate-binding protein [Nakamurella flava]TKV57855.1 carbohydrate ABC transporter substrate-binding protein [Nakamurella flava]